MTSARRCLRQTKRSCSMHARRAFPIVVASRAPRLNTGMRYSELRLLCWYQVICRRTVRVARADGRRTAGRSIERSRDEESASSGRTISSAKPSHFVFPSERYGARRQCSSLASTIPIRLARSNLEEGWRRQRKRRRQKSLPRFGHTCVTRCSRAAFHSQSSLRFLAGSAATRQRMANATATSGRSRNGRRSRSSISSSKRLRRPEALTSPRDVRASRQPRRQAAVRPH